MLYPARPKIINAWQRVPIINGRFLRGTLLILLWGSASGITLINPSSAQDEELSTHVQRIETDLAALRASNAQVLQQLQGTRLALAVQQLRIATQSHFPFSSEVESVRQLALNAPTALGSALAALSPYAATGVALVAELRDSFGLIILPKLEPLVATNPNQGWAHWAWTWLNWAVLPFGTSGVAPQQQMLVAATERLTEDNLAGAVQELEQFDGPAAAIVSRWIKEARARLTVDAAYNSLGAISVAILANSPL